MANDLVVDEAGQVFRQGVKGLEYVGPATELRANEGYGAKAGRVAEAIIRRGATDLPKFFADAIYHGGNELEKAMPITPSWLKVPMMQPSKAIDVLTGGEPPQGANLPEKLLIEGATGAVGGGVAGKAMGAATKYGPEAAKVAQKLLTRSGVIGGAGGGVGSETAAATLGDNPLSRLAGGLAGGVAAYPGMHFATGGGTANRVAAATKGIPDMALEAAKQKMIEGQRAGVGLNVVQASEQPTPLMALQEDAARSPSGPIHTQLIAGQTPQARQAAESAVGMFGLPKVEPTKVAEDTQKAATAAIQRAKDFPAKVTKDLYKFNLDELPQGPWRGAAGSLVDRINSSEVGSKSQAGQFLAKNILEPIVKGKVRDPQQIHTILQEQLAKLELPTIASEGIDNRSAGLIRKAINDTYGKLVTGSRVDEPYADAMYKRAYKDIIDPMRRGPVGKIAGEQGFDPAEGAKVDQILKVLDDPNIRAQSIQRLRAQLDKEEPQAFARYARAAMERKLEASFKGAGGQTPLNAPAKFAQAMWGGPDQTVAKENFRATMAAAAKSLGKKDIEAGEFVRGMEKLMSVIEAAGRGKMIASSERVEPAIGEAVKGAGAAVLYAPQATGVISRLAERLTQHATRQQIFEMIWTPEGVDKIRKYASMSIPQVREAFLAGTTVGTPLATKEK